jgi:F0F1-type ATP synthase assembly protein I
MDGNNPRDTSTAIITRALAQGSAIGLQVGCLAVVITIGALLLGLWLDGQLHTSPWLTIGLLIVSMPISVFVIFRFALRAARTLNQRSKQHEDKSA